MHSKKTAVPVVEMTLDTNSIDGELSLSDLDLEYVSGGGGGGGGGGSGGGSGKNNNNNRLSVTHDPNYKSSSTSFRYDPEAERDHIIGRKETRRVKYFKLIVILILTLLAVSVSLVIYFNVRIAERNEFETQYIEGATRIVDTVQRTFQRQQAIIENLAIHVAVASSSSSSGGGGGGGSSNNVQDDSGGGGPKYGSWPFITIPEFEARVASARHILGRHGKQTMLGLAMMPIVRNEERLDYETYTNTTVLQNNYQDWIIQDTSSVVVASSSSPFPSYIYRIGGDDGRTPIRETSSQEEEEVYFPIRQMFPVIPELVNLNMATASTSTTTEETIATASATTISSNPSELLPQQEHDDDVLATTKAMFDPVAGGILEAYNSKQVVLSQALSINDGTDINNMIDNTTMISSSRWFIESVLSLQQQQHHDNSSEDPVIMPISTLSVPIWDDTTTLVGIITTWLDWTSIFSHILPLGDDGFVLVLHNACNQTYTFRIDGPNSTFLSQSDIHDSSYDSFSVSFHLKDLFDEETSSSVDQDETLDDDYYFYKTYGSGGERTSRAKTWNDKYCPYTIRVYPSFKLERSFYSKDPVIYTLAVASIFLITTFVFVLYDCFVERRQKKVMQVALESRALVSSLFPAVVRDRLFQQRRKVHSSGDKGKNVVGMRIGGDSSRGSSGRNLSVTHRTGSSQQSSPHQLRPIEDATELEAGGGDMTHTEYGELDDPTTSCPSNNRVLRRTSINQSTIRIKSYLSISSKSSERDLLGVVGGDETKPIADLFAHTTVMFGDIVGFTSWSSQRDPEQVFTLLQAIFKSFDKAARKRGVFKVETIGDSYVAVTGLPDPQDDHAWRMCKFALECRSRMTDVTRELEVALGPDTGDLSMRFGMHSGAVTAGVLHGDKSRFQLFGDTVNMASRMESLGEKNRIQLSQSTADRLIATGKGGWIRPRETKVEAKGKGLVQTYWLASRSNQTKKLASKRRLSLEQTDGDGFNFSRKGSFSDFSSSHSNDESGDDAAVFMVRGNMSTRLDTRSDGLSEDRNLRRVVNWQSEMLVRSLKLIVARRDSTFDADSSDFDVESLKLGRSPGSIVLDEVVDAIKLPEFDENTFTAQRDPASVLLSLSVVSQLHDYVTTIASMYNKNAFHNFDHASHVAMSASKLLHHFVVPECVDSTIGKELHDITDGINSDPLTQFAVVFAAVIHDLDHPGVSNAQIAKEDPQMAELYRSRSLNEQKAVDIAWDLLMDPSYADLRACIYTCQSELERFRQLVVNCVMATDYVDKDSNGSRSRRWEIYFPEGQMTQMDSSSPVLGGRKTIGNPRATLVVELVLQASELAHTMQHWHVYRKWSECLFAEKVEAFEAGRSEKHPADSWYEDELALFDNYAIPLARKLQAFEVVGVSSNECLSYANDNRDEFAAKGRFLVAEMTANFQLRKQQSGHDQA